MSIVHNWSECGIGAGAVSPRWHRGLGDHSLLFYSSLALWLWVWGCGLGWFAALWTLIVGGADDGVTRTQLGSFFSWAFVHWFVHSNSTGISISVIT